MVLVEISCIAIRMLGRKGMMALPMVRDVYVLLWHSIYTYVYMLWLMANNGGAIDKDDF